MHLQYVFSVVEQFGETGDFAAQCVKPRGRDLVFLLAAVRSAGQRLNPAFFQQRVDCTVKRTGGELHAAV